MSLKKLLSSVLFLLLIFSATKSYGTHIMGGEITWECQPNGQYIFTLKVYRDCNGVGLNVTNEAIEVHDYPGPGSIRLLPLNFFSVTDITPSCEGSPCATLNRSDPDIPGAIEEYVLQTDPVTLNGVPPANGWTFTWTSGNRNAAIDNINNAQNFGITLRAKMFPYQARNANPCFDSSPDFFQKPSSIICAGEPFTYNHSAFDNGLDSLAYSWAQPLDGNACGARPCQIGGVYQENVNPVVVPFDAGNNYSFNSPFPDATQDPRNVAAVLDPITGEISFTSYNQGEYVSVIRVEAFKCGQKIAEIYRELQTVILAGCASNEPPIIPPPFANGTFSDTVKAGDFVQFDFNVYDTLRPDNPKNDSLFIFGSGQQFGTNFTDSATGCANPPCATLTYPLSDTALGSYTSTLKWQTTCDHISDGNPTCVSTQNTYLFVLRAFDDFCPAAGQSVATFSVTVLADELVPHPDIHCADVQANGDVIIDWNQTTDPDNSFRQWKIYTSINRNGPYTLIDSIADYNITTYTHSPAGANNQSIHYIVRAESGCHGDWFITPTDTILSMYIDPTFNNSCVNVSWNELDSPLPSGSAANYEVYREYPIGSGFSLYTTTNTTSFCDSFSVCTDSVTYRIQLDNSGNGCTGSSSNIKGIRFQYPDPAIDAGNEVDICDGQSVQIGGSPSGDPTATFTWTPNTNINNTAIANPTVRPLDTITYYLTVTDTLGCQAFDSVTVNVQPTPRANAGNDTLICVQNLPLALSGSVSISGTGRWIGGNGTFNPDRNSLTASYQPTNAEINGGQVNLQLVSTNFGICDPDTDQIVINITGFTSTLNINTTNVSCNGGSDGGLGVSANGATTPYTYNWTTPSGPANGDTLSNLSAGNYTLTATNGNGCDTVLNLNISEPPQLTAAINSTSDANCNGFSDGRAVVTGNGGTTPYTYLWSDNQTADTARNLAAGNYTVTITDANNCTATANTTITEPTVLGSSTATAINVSCNGLSDGKAYVTANGGTTPYTYLWSDNQTADTARNLAAANYTATVTDNNGCTSVSTLSITEPAVLGASISSTNNVSCNGGGDGTATVTANGGTTPYTYLWSNGQTAVTATNLAATNYVVTVTDNNGCTTTDNVTLSEPTQLTTANTYQENVSCNGLSDGLAAITPSGGTAPYTYLWSDNQTADTARNLTAATYTVTVTDNNGCEIVDQVIVSEPATLTAAAQESSQASCFGFSDGTAVVTGNGGTTPYTYLWSDNQTADTARNLAAGNYTVTITDANNCTATANTTITEPTVLGSSTATAINVSCNGLSDGEAYVTANGGTTPYTYLWSDNQTADTARNLAAANYTVTVTDNNGCTSVSTLSITEPAVLGASISSTNNVSCNGGSDGTATVTANGGTTPYTYLWSNGQTAVTATNLAATNYVVTVTDNNGCTTTANVTLSEPTQLTTANTYQENVSCNGLSDGLAAITPSGGTAPYTYLWSDNQTADTARNLTAATYTVTVTDNQGCALVENVTISEPVQLSISAQAVSQVSCNGLSNGSASANATGGTSPYSFLWSNNQVGDTARNLGAANYSVTITDQNGCTATTSVTISEPATLVGAIANSFDVSCNGGNDGLAVVDPQGGTAPYTYLWSNNQTADTTRNLNAGNYSVTITDQNACTATTAVIISEPSALTTTISSSTNISCNGLSDGIVTVSANGGTTPYTYLWSDNQTTATASNLPAGNYQVTVSDNNQCTSVESITLTEPASLVCSNGTQINASCKDLSDGSAKVIVNGGTQPYTYLWSDNQQTDSASNLSAGNYSVTVTDQNNCSSVSSFLITEPDSLLSATSITNGVSCTGFSNGEASVSATGGTQPYTYLWSNNSTNDTISGLFAGKYFVTLSDQNGCSIVDSVELVGPTQLVSTIGSSTDVSCNGGSDGFAYANANGGTPPYTYLWSNNANTDTLRNLSAGTYVLTLTDANGCNSGATVTINEPAALGLSITNESMVSCQGLSDAKAYVTVNGGTTPYTYLWNDNQASDTARNLSAGPYSVTVTDANACSSVISTTVTEPNALVSSMGSSTNVNCFGGSDGAATVTANGGTTPYTYNWNNGDNTATSSNLIAGTYFVTITDANGCVDSSNITITEPNLLSTTTSVNSPISCNNAANGIASVSPSGGTAPYTYNWSQGATTASISNLGPGTFLVTVTDNNQCSTVDSVTLVQPATLTTSISNATDVSCFSLADGQASVVGSGGTSPYTYFWSNNETTNSIQNLSAGTYGVTITDARGCQSSSSVSITQPAQLSATLNGSNISCFGQADGQISTAISGGTTPYNYNWSNGEQTPLINNLGAGTYLLTLSDFNNCQVTDSFTVIEPDTLSLTITADDTVCINVPKSLDATASGGTGAYTFTWNQNLGNSPSVSVSPQQNTTYSISVTDANNCPEAVRNVTLTVRDVASDSLNISSSGNICVGDSSLISVDFVGSIGPFSYQWNQTLSGIQDQYVSPTATTTYILDVIDACANTLTDSVEVAVSDPPVIALNDTLIEGCEDLSLTFSNQTPSNYTYSWNFGDGITSTEAEPSNTYTDPGTYSVQLNVSTPEGCESQSQANYRVRVLPSPIASIFASPTETDIENPDITISSDFSDANFWTWNFGDGKDSSNINDFVYTYADTGTYILNLLERNSFNCYDSAQLRIRINPNYEIKIPNVFIPSTGGPTGGTYNPNSTSNAVFHPFLEYVEDYHLMIFNRWGELMFESKDVNIGWDGYYKGKLCQADVYVYKMEVEFINGDRATKVGDLTLLR